MPEHRKYEKAAKEASDMFILDQESLWTQQGTSDGGWEWEIG